MNTSLRCPRSLPWRRKLPARGKCWNIRRNYADVRGSLADRLPGFGLRSASGESGAESGEKSLAERSRSATPAAGPQTEARRSCGLCTMQTRDERVVCEVERASSRGGRGDGQPVERSKPRVGHGDWYCEAYGNCRSK
ncbi:MAG: hypothetical protein ACR2H1_11350 [Limisphaerales bacterium]